MPRRDSIRFLHVGLATVAALVAAPALAEQTEWRFMGGAQVDAGPHGVLDFGVRRGDVSLQLLTDTLDLRWSPEWDRGRAWMAARAEYGAVGLLHSPWLDGEAAPELGFGGAYVGGEGGAVRYLPHGFYSGAAAFAYRTTFFATGRTAVDVPAPTPWLGADLIAGWYSEHTHIWARAGAQHDRLGEALQPHAHLVLRSASQQRWGHRAALHAGWGSGQSILTRTRVGGLNPYVVPLAGAGWAEWWAESYAVARLGPQLGLHNGEHRFTHAVVFDGGLVDDAVASEKRSHTGVWGLGMLQRWDGPVWFVQADLGWAAGVQRSSLFSRSSAWIVFGRPWK